MQNRTLSLIIGTALAMPSIAMAAPMDQGNVTPADMRVTPAPNTLQAEIEGPDGELLATQPGEVEGDVNVTETNPEEMSDPNMMGNPEEMSDPNMMGNPEEMSDPNMMENPEEMNDPNMMGNPEEMSDPNMMENPEEMNDPNMMGNPEEMNDPNMMENPEEMNDPNMMGNPEEMNDPNMMENPEEMANSVSEQAAPQALNQQHSNNEYQPLIAGEMVGDDVNGSNAPVTLQEMTKDSRGELLATQPAEVEFSENRRVVPR